MQEMTSQDRKDKIPYLGGGSTVTYRGDKWELPGNINKLDDIKGEWVRISRYTSRGNQETKKVNKKVIKEGENGLYIDEDIAMQESMTTKVAKKTIADLARVMNKRDLTPEERKQANMAAEVLKKAGVKYLKVTKASLAKSKKLKEEELIEVKKEEKVLWGVKKGGQKWAEQVISTNPSKFEQAKKWAIKQGFGNFRIATLDMTKRPDFAKTVKKFKEDTTMQEGLTTPEKHQLAIAKKTLKLSDAMAKVMGGPSKEEAKKIIAKLSKKEGLEEAVGASKGQMVQITGGKHNGKKGKFLYNIGDKTAVVKVDIGPVQVPISQIKEGEELTELKYTDNDWVLVDGRKAIKYFKNPPNNKAPSKFTKSRDQEMVRISKAKQMGIKITKEEGDTFLTPGQEGSRAALKSGAFIKVKEISQPNITVIRTTGNGAFEIGRSIVVTEDQLLGRVSQWLYLVESLTSDISRIKTSLTKKWKSKGAYENFGQKEVGKLEDKYKYSDMVHGTPKERTQAKQIDAFNDWCKNYTGESEELQSESRWKITTDKGTFVRDFKYKVPPKVGEKIEFAGHKGIIKKMTKMPGSTEKTPLHSDRYAGRYKENEDLSEAKDGETISLKGKKYVYHTKIKPQGWYLHDGNNVRFLSKDRPKQGQKSWEEVKSKRKNMGLEAELAEAKVAVGKWTTKGNETITVHSIKGNKATISGDDSKKREMDVDALKYILKKPVKEAEEIQEAKKPMAVIMRDMSGLWKAEVNEKVIDKDRDEKKLRGRLKGKYELSEGITE